MREATKVKRPVRRKQPVRKVKRKQPVKQNKYNDLTQAEQNTQTIRLISGLGTLVISIWILLSL